MDLVRKWFSRLPRFKIPSNYGIITAADDHVFRGLYLLIESCRDCVSVGLYDLGLSDYQRKWCSKQSHVQFLAAPFIDNKDIDLWQTWYKPFYVDNSPFEVTLWVDADCMVVNDLTPLFNYALSRPFVMRHGLGVEYVGNSDLLYEAFPTPYRLPNYNPLNSGVFGCTHDNFRSVMEKWKFITDEAIKKENVRNKIGWRDEGALHWAIEAASRPDIIINRPQWNRYVHVRASSVYEFLVLFKKEIADNAIVHLIGTPKCWDWWQTDPHLYSISE